MSCKPLKVNKVYFRHNMDIKNKIGMEAFNCFAFDYKSKEDPKINYVDKYYELERKLVLARDREEDLTRHLRNARANIIKLEEKVKVLNERLDKKIDEEIESACKESDYYKNSLIYKIFKFFRIQNGWI